MKALMAVVMAAFLMVGCAVFDAIPESVGAKLTVQQATMRVIDEDVPRAERVIHLTEEIGGYVQDERVTVAAVDGYLRSQIDWDQLSLADAQLVDMLLDEVRFRFEERLGDGVLAEDDKVVITTLLGWVADSAALVVLMRG